MGTVTTGDPGTEAAVTNSGTNQNAILDFTIPQGQSNSTSPDLLSAYSTPPQPGTSGNALLFDRNGVSYGSSISHTAGSGSFTLNKPGVYTVSFHGQFAPSSDSSFPANLQVNIQQDGNNLPGAFTSYTFQNANGIANFAMSIPVSVQSAPSTLQMVSQGSNSVYGGVTMNVYRLGDLPTS